MLGLGLGLWQAALGGGGVQFPVNLPSGALGLWVMDQYAATPRPHVPNIVGSPAVPNNLLCMSRRASDFIQTNAITLTEGLTGPDGVALATRMQVSSGQIWFSYISISGPAGTYTIAANFRSNTGADQDFKLGVSAGALELKTTTPAWQRFSSTGTKAAGAQLMFVASRPVETSIPAADILVDNINVYAGSSDLGAEAQVGHLMFGDLEAFSLVPTVNGPAVEYGANKNSGMSFPAINSAAWTVVAVGKKLSKTQRAFEAFTTMRLGNWANFQNSFGRNLELCSPEATLIHANVNNLGYRMFTSIHDATSADTYIDDVLVRTESGGAPRTWGNVSNCFTQNSSLFHDYAIVAMMAWPRRLSSVELATAFSSIKARLQQSGTVLTAVPNLYVSEGDSITSGNFAVVTYPILCCWNLNAQTLVYDQFPLGGETVPTVAARQATVAALLNAYPLKNRVLSVFLGANDLKNAANSVAFTTGLAAYIDFMKSAVSGLKVIGATVLPANPAGQPNTNTNRAVANPVILSWVGGRLDAAADFAGDPIMGPDVAALNTSLYPDGLHPNAAGQGILEPIMRAAVNSLLV